MTIEERLIRARDVAAARYLGQQAGRNVVGVGIGNKMVAGADTGIASVRIYVSAKRDSRDLSPNMLIPEAIQPLDLPTDVIEIDHRLGTRPGVRYVRPMHAPGLVRPGVSIGPNVNGAPNLSRLVSGTLGAVLQDVSNSAEKYLLSCNHVLAVKGRVPDRAAIVSPSREDHPEGKLVGTLFAHVPFHAERNYVDCALAKVEPSAEVSALFPDCRLVTEFTSPAEGQKVRKFGKATGETQGRIVDTQAEVFVDYSFGTFRFSGQVLIESLDQKPFAVDGDSGAVVLNEDNKALAMVFAPAGKFTVACSFPKIIEEFEKLGHHLKLAVG